jgi:hypothetical protein
MRKRKGIKVEVPGVENVSNIPYNYITSGIELTNSYSTTISYRRFLSDPIDFYIFLCSHIQITKIMTSESK